VVDRSLIDDDHVVRRALSQSTALLLVDDVKRRGEYPGREVRGGVANACEGTYLGHGYSLPSLGIEKADQSAGLPWSQPGTVGAVAWPAFLAGH